MSGRTRSVGVTKQDVETLVHVREWLAAQPNADPLALGVLDDVAERVTAGAKNAAIFRVRHKNMGNRSRAHTGPLPERPGTVGAGWHRWSDEDRDRLAMLFREGKHVDVIADEMGKSQGAIEDQIARLGLWHTRPHPLPRQVTYHTGGPLTRAKEAYAARKRREMGLAR
jgi:hypothetical protein